MNCRKRTAFWCMTMLAVVSLSTLAQAQTNPFTKAQVGDRIRKVEDGVDQFQTISKTVDKTPRTAPTRHKAAERQRAASVRIQRTQTLGQTKPSKQKTISKMPWTI